MDPSVKRRADSRGLAPGVTHEGRSLNPVPKPRPTPRGGPPPGPARRREHRVQPVADGTEAAKSLQLAEGRLPLLVGIRCKAHGPLPTDSCTRRFLMADSMERAVGVRRTYERRGTSGPLSECPPQAHTAREPSDRSRPNGQSKGASAGPSGVAAASPGRDGGRSAALRNPEADRGEGLCGFGSLRSAAGPASVPGGCRGALPPPSRRRP